MNKISSKDTILSIIFIIWVVSLDMTKLTNIQEVGIVAILGWFILLAGKLVRK